MAAASSGGISAWKDQSLDVDDSEPTHSDTETILATVRQTLSHKLDTLNNIPSFPKFGKELTHSRFIPGHRADT